MKHIILWVAILIPNIGFSVNTLQFKNLVPFSKKTKGVNEGAIYLIEGDVHKKVYVKGLLKEESTYNSLILSYQASRLLALICPGQGPLISPVLGGKTLMMASYDMPTFEGGKEGKRSVLLHLALDLMDITDRRSGNIGSVLSEGEELAAVVDIDMYNEFGTHRLSLIDKYFFKKDEFLSALSIIASFSDKTIKQVYDTGIHELDQPFLFKPIRKSFNVDFIFHNILYRKHQMEWVLKHFESVYEVLQKKKDLKDILKPEDISDDIYGIFLTNSAERNNLEMFNALLEHGSKPSEPALQIAAEKDNLEMVNALLAHGVKPSESVLQIAVEKDNLEMVNALLAHGVKPSESVLQIAVEKDNLEMVNALLAHGAKDPYGSVLQIAAQKANLEMVNVLLAHGFKDPYGSALKAAVEHTNLEMFNALLAHGVKDPYGYALKAAVEHTNFEMFNALIANGSRPSEFVLKAAVEKGNLEMVNALIAHGVKDPYGYALGAAVEKGNLEMVNALLAHGFKDPYGSALKAAVEHTNFEIFNALLAHGAKDPSGYALKAAVEKGNFEMFNALLAHGAKDPYGYALSLAQAIEAKKWFWERDNRIINLLKNVQN
jgi:ankyrin repeat protein